MSSLKGDKSSDEACACPPSVPEVFSDFLDHHGQCAVFQSPDPPAPLEEQGGAPIPEKIS